jgi:hypothetical protein
MSEEYARVAVLLEDIQTQVREIAEHQIVTGQRLDRLETRFDALDMKRSSMASPPIPGAGSSGSRRTSG